MSIQQAAASIQFDWTNTIISNEGGQLPSFRSFDINPEDFLIFAREDFRLCSRKSHVNALTNAKRVIDAQTDKSSVSLVLN